MLDDIPVQFNPSATWEMKRGEGCGVDNGVNSGCGIVGNGVARGRVDVVVDRGMLVLSTDSSLSRHLQPSEQQYNSHKRKIAITHNTIAAEGGPHDHIGHPSK